MVRMAQERVLLIGDDGRQMHSALTQALPGAQTTSAPSYFDGIAELAGGQYTAVVAAVEPIENRAEAAIRTIRQLSPQARVVLVCRPAHEPLSRRLLQFGCDDYIISPPSAAEFHEIFGAPSMRVAPAAAPDDAQDGASPLSEPSPLGQFAASLAWTDLVLDALLEHAGSAAAAAVASLNQRLSPAMQLHLLPAGAAAPAPREHGTMLAHPVRDGDRDLAELFLELPSSEESAKSRHFLAQVAVAIGKLCQLQDRHNGLQKLAITDDLTGLYNPRYFRHFLTQILEKGKSKRFPVTLLLFDIDNFKRYNDQFGHGVGDEILKQTASLMRRCCREHDLVSRIGGDEFAVVFWEKEGPRLPKDPKAAPPARTPQTPLQVFDRFRRLMATADFPGLGPAGRGVLTISAGMAVYPYDARDMEELISAADRELMFRAKRSGKNSIFLVGNEAPLPPSEEQP